MKFELNSTMTKEAAFNYKILCNYFILFYFFVNETIGYFYKFDLFIPFIKITLVDWENIRIDNLSTGRIDNINFNEPCIILPLKIL